ncbi:hypothetical protein BH09GEM1_BH09GEM1_37370 [soil metagenome]
MSEHARDSHDSTGTAVFTEAVYSRPMPGGGSVRAELLLSQPADLAGERLRGRVVMERRSFAPPSPDDEEFVVEEIEGTDQNAVVAELVRVARDNAAIARGVLRHGASVPRAD